MERVFKRQKITVGAVVKIPINDSVFSYARIGRL